MKSFDLLGVKNYNDHYKCCSYCSLHSTPADDGQFPCGAVLQCPGHGGAHQCNLQFTMCTAVSAVLLQPLHFVTLCGFPRPPWNTKPSVQTSRRRLTLFGLENTRLWEGCFYGYDFLFAWIKQLCPLMSMIKTYDVKWWSNCIAFYKKNSHSLSTAYCIFPCF